MQQVTYIMGASGSGKTTRTRELMASSPAGVMVISTDVIRAQLRGVLDRSGYPELWAESFDVPYANDCPGGGSPGADAGSDEPGLNVAGFARQCAPVLHAVEAGVAYALTEGCDCIVEGVHLVPGWFALPPAGDDLNITAELRVVRDEMAHRDLFADREKRTYGRRPAARYHEMIDNIRAVQTLLESRWHVWVPSVTPGVACSVVEVVPRSS
ncbi:MAG: hypothetical protein H7123_07640 [Thermoleophilia bacterium]|nr:hypothetical protein [Thermoleophilia bacterium]